MRYYWTVALLIATLHTAQAESRVVLEADFNSDQIGQAPDTSLPGGPEGDGLTLIAQSTGSSFLVVESAATLLDQPLQATRVAGPGRFACSFDLPTDAYGCQNVVVKWCAVAVTGFTLTNFSIKGPAGQFDFYGLLNFRSGGAITISPDVGVPNEVTIGSWSVGTAQCFEWHIDRQTGLQSVFIDGAPAVEGFATTWETTSTDVVAFEYATALQETLTYAIDDVEVSVVDCTTTPNAPITWGQVKAIYR